MKYNEHWCTDTLGMVSRYKNPTCYQPCEPFETFLAKGTIRSLCMDISTDVSITKTFCELSRMNLQQLHLSNVETLDAELSTSCHRLVTECPNLSIISLHALNLSPFSGDLLGLENLPMRCRVRYVRHKRPARLVDRLDQLCGVKVQDLLPMEAAKYGPSLKGYTHSRLYAGCLREGALRELQKCENIEELNVCLEPAATWGLGDVLRCCRKVRRLQFCAPFWADGVEGSLIQIAQEGHKLRVLKLDFLWFGAKEWENALKVFGDRLEILEVSYCIGDWGCGKKLDVLEVILGSIVEYNGRLKYIEVSDFDDSMPLHSDDEFGEISLDFLRRSASRLQDALPLLDMGPNLSQLVQKKPEKTADPLMFNVCDVLLRLSVNVPK